MKKLTSPGGQGVADLALAFVVDFAGRACRLIEGEATGVDEGEQLVARLAFGGTGEGFDAFGTRLVEEQGGYW